MIASEGIAIGRNPVTMSLTVYNVIDGVEIWDADIALKLLIEHETGWINGNVFQYLTMWGVNVFIDFEMSADIASTMENGFNRNLFLHIIGQMNGDVANTTVGARAIRHRANAFIDVKFWDFNLNPLAITSSIHEHAEDTLILGGIMTAQNFVDDGQRTQIIDPFDHRQLSLNRLDVVGGDLRVQDNAARTVFHLDSSQAHLRVGNEGNEGDLSVVDGQGRRVFHFNSAIAGLRLGANGSDGDLRVLDNNGNVTIQLDGQSGIVSSGNDCAENFAVADNEVVEPGHVMIFGDDGRLRKNRAAYDKRVAGVISGGGDFRPGFVLNGTHEPGVKHVPVALIGRVFCKVDARQTPVEMGDLLTTSTTPGYAMKANDADRALGATIGKALQPVAAGLGFIPIMVIR